MNDNEGKRMMAARTLNSIAVELKWISKSFPVYRKGLTILNPARPCKWGILIEDRIAVLKSSDIFNHMVEEVTGKIHYHSSPRILEDEWHCFSSHKAKQVGHVCIQSSDQNPNLPDKGPWESRIVEILEVLIVVYTWNGRSVLHMFVVPCMQRLTWSIIGPKLSDIPLSRAGFADAWSHPDPHKYVGIYHTCWHFKCVIGNQSIDRFVMQTLR